MMKKFTIATIMFFALMLSSTANAQFFSFGVGGGLTNVVGSEDYTNDISKDGLGYSTEWNGGVIVKIGLPLIPITPRAFILYHTLNGSEDNVDLLGKGTSINSTRIENSQSILSVGLGVQYGFIPIPVGVDPYLFIDLSYNNFGELKTTTFGIDSTFSGGSRFGLGFGIGATITIIPIINLDLMASYNMYNLVGKEENENSLSTITLDAFLLFSFL